MHTKLAQDDLPLASQTEMVLFVINHTKIVHNVMRKAQDRGHHTKLRQASAHLTRQDGANYTRSYQNSAHQPHKGGAQHIRQEQDAANTSEEDGTQYSRQAHGSAHHAI